MPPGSLEVVAAGRSRTESGPRRLGMTRAALSTAEERP